jgi:hypothetical protein
MAEQADYRYVLMESIAGLMEKAREMAPSTPYEQGRSMAYFEILSALKDEAEAAGIAPEEIGLEDVGYLVGLKKAA